MTRLASLALTLAAALLTAGCGPDCGGDARCECAAEGGYYVPANELARAKPKVEIVSKSCCSIEWATETTTAPVGMPYSLLRFELCDDSVRCMTTRTVTFKGAVKPTGCQREDLVGYALWQCSWDLKQMAGCWHE